MEQSNVLKSDHKIATETWKENKKESSFHQERHGMQRKSQDATSVISWRILFLMYLQKLLNNALATFMGITFLNTLGATSLTYNITDNIKQEVSGMKLNRISKSHMQFSECVLFLQRAEETCLWSGKEAGFPSFVLPFKSQV